MGIEYRPLTESFRELNRMLIEKQAWDAEFKLREGERGIKNMMMKSQLESANQQQQMMAYKLGEQERLHTPQIIQLSKIIQGGPEQLADIEANPEAMAKLTQVLDDEGVGYKYSPADKTWKHPLSGEPIRFSRYEMQFRAPGMFGIIDGYTDNVVSMKRTQADLASQLVAIDKDISEARKGQYTKQALQDLTRQRQELVSQYKEATEFLTNEGLLNYYENKQKNMLKRSSFYYQLGAKELGDHMQKNADQAAASKRVILNNMMTGKGEGKLTGQVKLYAIKPTIYKGIKYKVGATRLERWSPAETEKTYDPELWSTEDPLAVKKRVGGGADDFRQNFKIGLDIVQRSALPQNLIIAHPPNRADFRDAADKMYTQLVRELEGGVVTTASDARALGHEALRRTIFTHEKIKRDLDRVNMKKKVGRNAYILLNDDGKPIMQRGKPKEYTKEELDQALKVIKQQALLELGYVPTWRFMQRQVGGPRR